MFRKIRRKNQILSQEENITILQNGTTGTLAVLGDNDYPYTVPINYFYENDKIYFHCAKAGHKIDAIKKHNKVSFCVIAQDDLITEKFTAKFAPDQSEQKRTDAIKKEFPALGMIEMTIEHVTGKQALELMKK